MTDQLIFVHDKRRDAYVDKTSEIVGLRPAGAYVYVTGGSETTEDAPYLLTDAFLSQTCTVHNEFNSTYTGTNSFPGSTGVNPIGADPAGDASTPDASTTTTDPAATTDQSVDGQ